MCISGSVDRTLEWLAGLPCLDRFMYKIGPPMALGGAALVLAIVRVGLYSVLPIVVPPGGSAGHYFSRYQLHVAWSVFISFNVLWNYAMGVFTDPGGPKSEAYKLICRQAREKGLLRSVPVVALPRPGQWTRCRKSGMLKPPRAHYDRVTQRLVLRMDHYCPWLFNTVGWRNMRYYLLFLVYVVVGTLYIVVMTLRPFMSCLGNPSVRNPPVWGTLRSGVRVTKPVRDDIIFLFVASASVLVLVGALLVTVLGNVLSGQTTIEATLHAAISKKAREKGSSFRNPYDQGVWRNWAQLMGSMPILAALMPSCREPPWPPYAGLTGVLEGGQVEEDAKGKALRGGWTHAYAWFESEVLFAREP